MLRKNIRTVLVAASMLMGSNIAHADPISDFLDRIFKGNVGQVTIHSNTKGRHNYRVSKVRESYGSTSSSYEVGSLVRASYYGHGEKLNAYTASGARFNPYGFTAAHRSARLGSKLLVSYNGRQVVVVVNDRGPAAWTGRSLDLSYGAARALGMTQAGVGMVRIAQAN